MNEKFFEKFEMPQKGEKKQPAEAESSTPITEELREKLEAQETEKLRKELEETTRKYEEDERFKETVEKLKNLAQEQKMGLLIKKEDGEYIEIGLFILREFTHKETLEKYLIIANCPENTILVGEKILDNIRGLFLADENLTKEGLGEIFSHEAQHQVGLAGKLHKQKILEIKKIAKEAKSLKEAGEKIKELEERFEDAIEMTTELQRRAKTYTNLDDFIKTEAKTQVVIMVAYRGFDYLRSVKFSKGKLMGPRVDTVKPQVKKRIVEEMDKIKENLLKNYEEKVKEKRNG
jgi:hypothetical protein